MLLFIWVVSSYLSLVKLCYTYETTMTYMLKKLLSSPTTYALVHYTPGDHMQFPNL